MLTNSNLLAGLRDDTINGRVGDKVSLDLKLTVMSKDPTFQYDFPTIHVIFSYFHNFSRPGMKTFELQF